METELDKQNKFGIVATYDTNGIPLGAVCSGSRLFASILNFFSNARQLFAADDFSRRHFQMHFSWRFKG